MRRLAFALLALPALTAPALAQMVTVTPHQIGEMFCIARIGNDDGILTGALSDELRSHIAYAEARNATIATAAPDEKPPLGDGIPWASFPDYPSTCTVGSVATEDTTAKVAINYGFADDPSADFADTLILKQVPHPYDPNTPIWRLDDITYTVDGSLRGSLDGMFASYQ